MSAVMPEAVPGRPTPANASAPPVAVAKPVDPPEEASAADRLEMSRARLRLALLEIAHPPPKASLLDDLPGISDLRSTLVRWASTIPGVALVVDSVEDWWRQHPLRTAGVVAKEAGAEFLVPVARRNPYAFVLGAAVVGGLFVLSKPWRWMLRPALFVGLVPQIASHALRRMPIDTWLHMASGFLARRKPDPAPAAQGPGPL